MDDIIAAMDKRAQGRIVNYDHRHGLLTGYVMGVEIDAASVQLEGSGRYLKSVPTLQDMELAVGDLVLLVRAGRSGWLIVGSAASSQTTIPSTYRYDHGLLAGLTDDDHEQYFLANGGRAISGNVEGSGYPNIGSTTLTEKFGNIYLGSTKQVYEDNDSHPAWERRVNYGQGPQEHWPQGSDELTWTGWAGYTGFVTPSSITRTNSFLTVSHSSAASAFYYRSASGGTETLYARLGLTFAVQGGLMVDDGVNAGDGNGANNFYRCMFYKPAGQHYIDIRREYRTGGGGVTTTTYSARLDATQMHSLVLLYGTGTPWTNWGGAVYLTGEGRASLSVAWDGAVGFTWTPARHGLYFGSFSAGTDRRAIFDWFRE
ncbi:MAG: hypothetical protein GWN58_27705 [Anaerolineae bacterium]|nr:hypothetical protein [Anaerolineae bacterium]